jgi:hypothetical protein
MYLSNTSPAPPKITLPVQPPDEADDATAQPSSTANTAQASYANDGPGPSGHPPIEDPPSQMLTPEQLRKEHLREEALKKQFREIDKQLTAPDAVLGKNIFTVATKYLQFRPRMIKEVVQKLSDNYVGYPAMASLVCDWLSQLEHPETQEHNASGPGVASSAILEHGH